jgi:hypothetical protein
MTTPIPIPGGSGPPTRQISHRPQFRLPEGDGIDGYEGSDRPGLPIPDFNA